MQNKPKIVVLNDFAYIAGGASQVALASAVGLARRGYGVTFVSAVGPVEPGITAHPNLQVVCTHQHDIAKDPKPLRAAGQGIWNPRAGKTLSKVLDHCDARNTIVHVHSFNKALSSSVMREAVRRNFRVVLTLHDYFVACPNGGFFIHPTERICPLRGMSSKCIRTNCDSRSYLHKLWRVGRQAVQNRLGLVPEGIKHFIAISDLSYGVLRSYLPKDASVHFVSNPIDTPKKDPTEIQKNTAYVAVGRLSKEKGLPLLAEASRRVGAHAIFVGEGDQRGQISRVNPDATITGWVPHREVVDYLSKARALVLPSLLYEAQPLAPYEAAALGVPAIVSHTCAAREMIEDGVTGLLFESGNASDLASKIAVLREDRTARNMGLAAYERYWANPPTEDLHLQKLEKVYTQVLNS